MNDQIKELAGQACDTLYDGDWNIPDEFIEKFAELIVRECMKQGDVLVKHYIDTHTEQDQALLLASIADYTNQIKKHFGVE